MRDLEKNKPSLESAHVNYFANDNEHGHNVFTVADQSRLEDPIEP